MLPRRSQAGADGTDALPDELRCGSTEIDFRSYEARSNGEPVEITRKEFAVLRFLASRAGPGSDAGRSVERGVGIRVVSIQPHSG
ncbi:MAG: hypothetical protein ACLQU1_41980 [Bryobacteraceae bacterium]